MELRWCGRQVPDIGPGLRGKRRSWAVAVQFFCAGSILLWIRAHFITGQYVSEDPRFDLERAGQHFSSVRCALIAALKLAIPTIQYKGSVCAARFAMELPPALPHVSLMSAFVWMHHAADLLCWVLT